MTVNHALPDVRVRAIAAPDLPGWLAMSGTRTRSDELLERRLRSAWDDGTGGPDRTFVVERGGRAIGRLAWLTSPAASSLPDFHEATIAGLLLPWEDPDAVELGRRLVEHALGVLRPPVRAVDAYANPEYMPGWQVRRAVFEAVGMPLFQRKEGFLWTPETAPAQPPGAERRLTFRSIAEIGPEPFVDVMARATRGTLDRQDRYYADLTGEEGWGREMLGYLTDADADSWLLGVQPDGAAAGYVLLGAFDEPDRGTINHIGVVPEARGRGYVDELLAELEVHALRRGFARVLSDVDVLNTPMRAAMERAGHRAAATAWHVWHYRLEL